MLGKEYTYQQKIAALREREKELKCLYRVEEAISKNLPQDEFFNKIIRAIPNGWQYPAVCKAKITYEGKEYKEPGWNETEWKQEAILEVDDKVAGKIEVFYTASKPLMIDSPFLPEEFKLLNTIANLVSTYIFSKKIANSFDLLNQKAKENNLHKTDTLTGPSDTHWKWRYSMVQTIAGKLDLEHYGLQGLYLIGSTKEATAGPASDIDLLFHIKSESRNRNELVAWLDGWSQCLSEINFHRTGYKTDGLIDSHFITDEDIRNKTSYAVMIGSTENSAKPVKLAN
jgi:hypothetical protein